MAFAQANIEDILQVNDLTRLEFLIVKLPSDGTIDLIEVEPEIGAGFFDITNNSKNGKQYIDYLYETDGDKVVTLRVTIDGAPMDYGFSVSVLTKENDRLFSGDSDLVDCEDDILGFIRKGRASFIDKHREAQRRIISELDQKRILTSKGERLTPVNIADLEEVRSWSKYLTLQIIFEGLVNESGDVFSEKAESYASLATKESSRAAIRLQEDLDGDGNLDEPNNLDLKTTRLMRR